MLLSFERPFVGAVAFEIPRATLLHRNGLVRAVLPESDWIMCKRTNGVPKNFERCCRFLGNIPAGDTGLPTPGLGGALVRRGAIARDACGNWSTRTAFSSFPRWSWLPTLNVPFCRWLPLFGRFSVISAFGVEPQSRRRRVECQVRRVVRKAIRRAVSMWASAGLE